MTASTLELPADRGTADALAAALESILSYAAQQIARVDTDPASAVHEYRKSLRRARSLVRIARPSVSRRNLRKISVALKLAHTASSSLRDAEILDAAIEMSGVDRSGDLAAAVEKHRGQELVSSRIRSVLARGAELPGQLPAAFVAALPADMDEDALFEGVRKTYRQARRELDRATRIPDPVHIHNWRKRNKDVVYQLELLGPLLDERGAATHAALAKLSRKLGRVTDLFVLLRFLRGEPGLSSIADEVDRLAKKKFRRARKKAATLYSAKPKKFVKRLR